MVPKYAIHLIYVKLIPGMECFNRWNCEYWTWIEDHDGIPSQECFLKDASDGFIYKKGIISGSKSCNSWMDSKDVVGGEPNLSYSSKKLTIFF